MLFVKFILTTAEEGNFFEVFEESKSRLNNEFVESLFSMG